MHCFPLSPVMLNLVLVLCSPLACTFNGDFYSFRKAYRTKCQEAPPSLTFSCSKALCKSLVCSRSYPWVFFNLTQWDSTLKNALFLLWHLTIWIREKYKSLYCNHFFVDWDPFKIYLMSLLFFSSSCKLPASNNNWMIWMPTIYFLFGASINYLDVTIQPIYIAYWWSF